MFLLSQVPICKTFIERGTQKQAKQAVKCLFMNSTATRDEVFQEILDIIKVRMSSCMYDLFESNLGWCQINSQFTLTPSRSLFN